MNEQLLVQLDRVVEECEAAELNVALSIVEESVKMIEINELHRGDSLDNFAIFQEGRILDEAVGKGNDESFVKKALLLIPRLIDAIIKAIKNKLFWKQDTTPQNAFLNYGKMSVDGLSKYDIEGIKKQKKESPIYKAIIAAGCTGVAIAGAGIAFRISDYSEAVEFKDDVSFTISEISRVFVLYSLFIKLKP